MSCNVSAVKAELLSNFGELLDPLLDAAAGGTLSARDAEIRTWKLVVQLGLSVLTSVLSLLCLCAAEAAVLERGLTLADVRFRMDDDYIGKLNSTFGRLRFPWFAFRDGEGHTHAPARRLFPQHPKMRVTELLLEWECALAADHPFRKAADALLFFSHGAADVEDTTIERHAVLVGNAVPVEMLYLKPEKLREVLQEKASRDSKTGRPIIYASTDAHALKRFVDENWDPKWKMVNGIRLWCIDQHTDKVIHIGGEFTWGDCHDVADRFRRLQRTGILPMDGDYGDGLVAQVALCTDGLDWIAEHVLPLFPDAVLVLDPYHVVEQVAATAAKLHPGKKGKAAALRIVKDGRKALGMRNRRKRAKQRGGLTPTRYQRKASARNGSGQRLLDDVLFPLLRTVRRGKKRLLQVIAYVRKNVHRMDYGDLRARGFKIGSGAMESLHRTGSQVRLKRAGCHWTETASQAILNLRMLGLSGRWADFWSQATDTHLPALTRCS